MAQAYWFLEPVVILTFSVSATREAFLKPTDSWLWFRALLQQTRVPRNCQSLVAPAMLRVLVFVLPCRGSFKIIPAAHQILHKWHISKKGGAFRSHFFWFSPWKRSLNLDLLKATLDDFHLPCPYHWRRLVNGSPALRGDGSGNYVDSVQCTGSGTLPTDPVSCSVSGNFRWAFLVGKCYVAGMDGWMEGRKDGWIDGLDGWMDGWTDGRTDGWTDGRTDGWMDGWWIKSVTDCTRVVLFGFPRHSPWHHVM